MQTEDLCKWRAHDECPTTIEWTAKTDLVLDESCEGEVIEQVGEVPPDIGVSVFSKTLVVKAIYLRNLSRFVVSAEDCDAVPVAKLESDEQSHGFDRIIAAIDIVAHEEVVGIRRVAPDAEKL